MENDLTISADETSADTNIALEKREPTTLHVFPLAKRPFFPGMAAPILVETGPFYEALKKVSKSKHKTLGLFLMKNEKDSPLSLTSDKLHSVGVSAKILRIIPIESGGAQIVLSMQKRIVASSFEITKKQVKAHVDYFHDLPSAQISKEEKAYSISIVSTIKELLKLNPLFKEELQIFLGHSDFTESGKLADFSCALTTATRDELQEILESIDVTTRLEKALEVLKKELDISRLQSSINDKIETSLSKVQREFFLREQLKTIKKELGLEKDDKQCDIEKFEKRIEGVDLPPDVETVINDEIEKISLIDLQSPEYGVSRNYLDWLTNIPWNHNTEDQTDIAHASKVLDRDHYGLKDIKERILEFISVGSLTKGMKGSIICLVGPPGVGKTSVGKSIAKAIGREFYRFSVGGMRDESEVKGHRRTYIGAMPGKIAHALKTTGCMNPVILIDEIDKMGASHHGDPGAALLEALDPEQNTDFVDNYLDVKLDISNVIFIVTANVLDTIPGPLLDRMEVLRLSGYIEQEKVKIAQQYLIPRHRSEMGLNSKVIQFSPSGIKKIMEGYARESGVRTLDMYIKKILRKIAKLYVESGKDEEKLPYKVTSDSLDSLIGIPVFSEDRYYKNTPPGVTLGLAWTSMGGALLNIESIQIPSDKQSISLTGQAGDVMKESCDIAWSYLAMSYKKYTSKKTFFKKMKVHMHIPEGATPKDGPSAGITMTTSLLSLLSNRKVKQNLSMTGEITLTGKVLPIGGVKEKILAARRGGIKEILFPKDNEKDVVELPDYLKKGITIHFVSHYDEVFSYAFK